MLHSPRCAAFLAGLVTLVVSVGASFATALPAGATSWHLLPNGRVVVLSSSLGQMTTPVDGRLRGPDFQVTVTGVTWPAHAVDYVPNSGHRLVAFRISLTEGTNAGGSNMQTATNVSLVVNGATTHLDTSNIAYEVSQGQGPNGTGTASYLASVPNDTTKVSLAASDATFSQNLSLWSLKRTSSAPSALYADSVDSFVTGPVNRTFNVPIRNPSDGVTLNSVLRVTSAQLTGFSNDGLNTPAPRGKSYLTLSMTSGPTQTQFGNPNWGHFFTQMSPYPGTAVTFAQSQDAPITAVMTNPINQANNANGESDDGLVDASYRFLVPKSTTSGTINFHPFVTNGVEYTGFVGSSTTTQLHVGGPTAFAVTFPAAIARHRQPTPPWVGQPVPATGIPGSGGIGGGSGISIFGAVLALILIGGAVFLWRRRQGTATPAGSTGPIVDAVVIDAPVVVHGAIVDDRPSPPAPAVAVVDEPVIDSRLHINFLGPMEIEPRSGNATDLVRAIFGYLSLQEGRKRSGDTIQAALWPLNSTERDVSKKNLLNYISTARGLVGVAHFPEAKGQRGYELLNFTTDWMEFQRLAAEAADSSEDAASTLHHQALELIRGSLFEDEESFYFDFVRDDGHERLIQNAVSSFAHERFREAMVDGDLEEAEWAVNQGLKIDRRDMTLWTDLTDVIKRRGNTAELDRHFAHADGVLGPDLARELRT